MTVGATLNSLWGSEESNPVILNLSSTTSKSKPDLEVATLTGPVAMFKGTEIQIHYYKKEERCAIVAKKEIFLKRFSHEGGKLE